MDEDIFKEAQEALQRMHDENQNTKDSMLAMLSNQNPTVVRLSDGDWHVCEREHCPYSCLDLDSHMYFCSLCGLCWGTEFVTASDSNWTGRSTTTCDPDAISGTPVGGWRPRRDAFTESQRAFRAASNISDKEVTYVETTRERKMRESRSNTRRGAICVDQVTEQTKITNKHKAANRPHTRELYEKLSSEVATILHKLTSVKKDHDNTLPKHNPPSSVDVRLQNPEFVTRVAIHQVLKRVSTGKDVINSSRLHDLVVYATHFAKRKRSEALELTSNEHCKKKRSFTLGGDTKTRIVNLVLSLWKAACATQYLSQDAKRGADSFRPFVSGILYATKRGVCMSDGLEIVPEIQFLADQLPTLRSHNASYAAKQLQSSSHRGLCCLHRSIASFETADTNSPDYEGVKQAFQNAAAVAAQLKAYFS
jgi:hypothetical protein